ncbi:hypothetical protein NSS91_16820 [Caldifermentibacillus hisashii]|uniref:hypothetical protein n=1 Tax=Caldifermentibacillus hisashii TaxID=996558 RepID=UPI0031FC1ADE
MDKEEQEYKQFLEQQLQWCKKQDNILAKREIKLHEMKTIAQYILNHELTAIEIDRLNYQFKELQKKYHLLEVQLQSVVH